MNRNILLVGTAIVVLMTSAAQAAGKSKAEAASGESQEQQCARWAGNQNLQGADKAEYMKDCPRDLRVPDKKDDGDGE